MLYAGRMKMAIQRKPSPLHTELYNITIEVSGLPSTFRHCTPTLLTDKQLVWSVAEKIWDELSRLDSHADTVAHCPEQVSSLAIQNVHLKPAANDSLYITKELTSVALSNFTKVFGHVTKQDSELFTTTHTFLSLNRLNDAKRKHTSEHRRKNWHQTVFADTDAGLHYVTQRVRCVKVGHGEARTWTWRQHFSFFPHNLQHMNAVDHALFPGQKHSR